MSTEVFPFVLRCWCFYALGEHEGTAPGRHGDPGCGVRVALWGSQRQVAAVPDEDCSWGRIRDGMQPSWRDCQLAQPHCKDLFFFFFLDLLYSHIISNHIILIPSHGWSGLLILDTWKQCPEWDWGNMWTWNRYRKNIKIHKTMLVSQLPTVWTT